MFRWHQTVARGASSLSNPKPQRLMYVSHQEFTQSDGDLQLVRCLLKVSFVSLIASGCLNDLRTTDWPWRLRKYYDSKPTMRVVVRPHRRLEVMCEEEDLKLEDIVTTSKRLVFDASVAECFPEKLICCTIEKVCKGVKYKAPLVILRIGYCAIYL